MAEKNDVMSMFNMADLRHLGFYGSIMTSLKSPCTTFCHHSLLRQMVAQKQQKTAVQKRVQKNNKQEVKVI